jgi:hypothetical protein
LEGSFSGFYGDLHLVDRDLEKGAVRRNADVKVFILVEYAFSFVHSTAGKKEEGIYV